MKIIVNGAGGRMGKALRALIAQGSRGASLAAAVDPFVKEDGMIEQASRFTGDADCIIDFSSHTGTKELVEFAVERKLPLVIATTGHTQEELDLITQASREIPVFYSGNMSLGIALLTQLVRQSVAMFPDADVEIVETHHAQKVDVPSGTALMLAKAVQTARPSATLLVGRHENGKRTKEEVGIHSLRMGTTVGIHEVHIHAGTQTITLKHEAHDRALFAEGALAAAQFLTDKAPGLYSMHDMVK
ncbi:MAG: 4-hydroxy-tetrahydrodipicolinate reductase [Oscillospiraceae bacterium]|nr:4-hydroxy-tetrahydrodipicolinate reductase [Oscillospiraceae bacterium]